MMYTTRAFKIGESQSIRIPAELAFEASDIELEIERVGVELRIRPVRRTLACVLQKFDAFPADFMAEGRAEQEQDVRDLL